MKLVTVILLALFSASCSFDNSSHNSTNNSSNNTENNLENSSKSLSTKADDAISTSGDTKLEPELSQQVYVLNELSQAIELAKQNNDYRMLVTSGRNMSIPGVEASDYQRVITLCGKKYNEQTGDIIRTTAQREARKQIISFMQQYNEQILPLCEESKTDK